MKQIAKENDLILLQEVVDDWYYNSIQNTLSSSNHISVYVNNTNHGILTSWNQERYRLVNKHTYLVNQHIVESNYKLFADDFEEATKKVKDLLIVVLWDHLLQKNIFVMNYHFPCLFKYENVMKIHSKSVINILNEVLLLYKEELSTAFVIFGSDTNSQPKTKTILNLQKHFQFGTLLDSQTHTTLCQKNDFEGNTEPFVSILDYIMISSKLKFRAYEVLLYQDRISPNIKNPSDHNPIRAIVC